MIAEIDLKSIQQYQIRRAQILSSYPIPLGLSDSAIYCYVKQATFLSKKQERSKLYFFQGLNTYPQNLSIFLRDQIVLQTATTHSKQKIVKGIFNVYDFYSKTDCVMQINIPGNLRIYKIINGKKQAVSNQQSDQVYLSSVLRSIYQKNLVWGRYYRPFRNQTNHQAQFQHFLKILLKIVNKKDVFINDQFQSTAFIKGSHSLSLLIKYVMEKRIASYCIQLVKKQIQEHQEYRKSPKINLLMAELYCIEGKFSKSIQYTNLLVGQYSNDPYILYNKAKYLIKLFMLQQALQILNSIVQYNQFQVWCLIAQILIHKKNFGDALICLNHATKVSKFKTTKNIQTYWQNLQQLGKARIVTGNDPMHFHPKINIKSQSPISIPVKLVQQKYKPILQHISWKLNKKQLIVYRYIQRIFYSMQITKFHKLLEQFFLQSNNETTQVTFKKGLTQSMFVDIDLQGHHKSQLKQQGYKINIKTSNKNIQSQSYVQQLPNFLQEQQDTFQPSFMHQTSRNLSVIPQLQSMIQNSNFEQKSKFQNKSLSKKNNRFHKRQMNESFFKLLNIVVIDIEFQKILNQQNLSEILKTYNQLKRSAFSNNYFAMEMFKILSQKGQYKVIVVLLAQILDFIQSKGIKKIRKLPYWLEQWIFFIINEKGLTFLNKILTDLKFQDQAVLDTIELARKWQINGVKN